MKSEHGPRVHAAKAASKPPRPCTLQLVAAGGGRGPPATISPDGVFGCCAGTFSSLAESLVQLWKQNASHTSWPAPEPHACEANRLSFGCIFEPITSCSLGRATTAAGCHTRVRFQHHHCDSDVVLRKQVQRALPRMLRLQPRIRHLVDERKHRLGLPARYIALQIRGGDKPGTEALYYPPSTFLDTAVDGLQAAGLYDQRFDKVFLMTDDYNAVDALRGALNSPRTLRSPRTVVTMAKKSSRMAGKTAASFGLGSVDGFVQFWAESELAANATVLVGSESSNVGRWLKWMREDLSPAVHFRNVETADVQQVRNLDVASSRNNKCSDPQRPTRPSLCTESWHRVVLAVHAAAPVQPGRLDRVGGAVLDLIDAVGVLLAAGVAFQVAASCPAGTDWRSDWSCAFSPAPQGACPATQTMSASAINHAAADVTRLAALYEELGVKLPVPSNNEEHLLRACMTVSLSPFTLGYGHMTNYCSRAQLRRIILRRYLCVRADVRADINALKSKLTKPWVDQGKQIFLKAPATQSLLEKQHLYDAFQMQRAGVMNSTSLPASLMHAMYRSLSRFPYYGAWQHAGHPLVSTRQQDMGLFILASDLEDVEVAQTSVAGFPNTLFANYRPNAVSMITDPLTHDPGQRPDSDRDAFVHFWASVELAAGARWLFTTASSRIGILVEAVREPSEREPAVRVPVAEEASA